MKNISLIEKYNVPIPRYTSYPTVPYWENSPDSDQWSKLVKASFDKTNNSNGLSIYIHLPYCESICTFCGCNKRITRNHNVELPYIRSVLREWEMYRNIFQDKPLIKEIHLGGGTPTFFSSESLKILIEGILRESELSNNHEFGIEVHPNVTNKNQLETLYNLGFRRLSLGVQDFDPAVQEIINRIQPYENVEKVNNIARELGFESINFDLVYGLPLQKKESIIDTINKVKRLMPDRIAFYSYAHVPWKSPGQRKFTENDLPTPENKRKLYELGREMLSENGYLEIGMDHFAMPSDSLFKAMADKKLHRNFMGYTSFYTELLIGLGVSSIGDTWNGFMQNNKDIDRYMQQVNKNIIPISTGHVLNDEDIVLRRHILNLMCNFSTDWNDLNLQHPSLFLGLSRMKELEKDGLVEIFSNKKYMKVTEAGKTFIRNICMALDNRLWNKQPVSQLFSKAI